MPIFNILTAREERDMAEAAGFYGPALEERVRRGRHNRHMARVLTALLAARGSTEETPPTALPSSLEGVLSGWSDSDLGWSWAMLSLDALGIGGHDGLTGDRTDRLPCFRNCGSARKQARDGAAWTSAITEARKLVEAEVQRRHAKDAGWDYEGMGWWYLDGTLGAGVVTGPDAILPLYQGFPERADLKPWILVLLRKAIREWAPAYGTWKAKWDKLTAALAQARIAAERDRNTHNAAIDGTANVDWYEQQIQALGEPPDERELGIVPGWVGYAAAPGLSGLLERWTAMPDEIPVPGSSAVPVISSWGGDAADAGDW